MLGRLTLYDGEDAYRGVRDNCGYLIKISSLYPRLGGINTLLGLTHYFSYVGVIIFNLFLLMYTVIHSTDNMPIMCEILHVFFLMFIVLNLLLFLFLARPEFSRIYSLKARGFFNYNDIRFEVEKLRKQNLKYTRFWLIFWPTYYVSCSLFLFASNFIDDKRTSQNQTNQLPLPYVTPYNSSSGVAFYGTVFIQYGSSFVFSTVLPAADFLYVSICMEIQCQISILRLMIRKLPQRALTKYLQQGKHSTQSMDTNQLFKDPQFQLCYQVCLRDNIKHHQLIISAFEDFKKLCNLTIFVPFLSGGVMLASVSIIIISNSGQIGSILTSIAFAIGDMVNFTALCWFGELLTTESKLLREEVYTVNWYECAPAIKRTFSLMLEVSSRPLVLEGGRIIRADLRTLADIVCAAYSYFNILLAARP